MAADSQGKQEETSMKVAVVTDSNSGITQAQAKEMGVYVLPMPFMIDGTEYLEDINLTQKEFYEHLSGDHDVSTSQPSPETILNLWEKTFGGIRCSCAHPDVQRAFEFLPDGKDAGR